VKKKEEETKEKKKEGGIMEEQPKKEKVDLDIANQEKIEENILEDVEKENEKMEGDRNEEIIDTEREEKDEGEEKEKERESEGLNVIDDETKEEKSEETERGKEYEDEEDNEGDVDGENKHTVNKEERGNNSSNGLKTFVDDIFGGKLESVVTCLRCLRGLHSPLLFPDTLFTSFAPTKTLIHSITIVVSLSFLTFLFRIDC
jgi:hypothetical protein